jgi:hypothetical protein
MSKLSKRQEKKRKMRERERASTDPAALAYHGNKYRTEALVKPLMDTETAILEAYVLLDRQLTDHEVGRALVKLIEQLRRGAAVTIDARGELRLTDDRVDTVVQMVHQEWARRVEGGTLPGRNNLIGILRTILASVETRKTVNPQSRSYLQFIERFLGKLGVQVMRAPAADECDDEAGEIPNAQPPYLPR